MKWPCWDYEDVRSHSLSKVGNARSDDEHPVVRGPSR